MVDRLGALPRAVRLALGAALVLLALALVALLVGGRDAGPPPADAATRLVPAKTLVYVHLSTDRDRPGTEKALALAKAFPGYERAVESITGRLVAPGCGVETKDLEGKEVSLALVDTGGGTAGSLVLIDTGREGTPEAPRTCGRVQTQRVGRFLAIGQPATLQGANDLFKGDGRSLADDPLYAAALAKLPAGRVADGWVSEAGVRRLLAPQGGLLGAAGTLLDQPGLRAAALAVTAEDDGARLTVRSQRGGPGATTFKPFEVSLDDEVPDDAFAYLGLAGLSGAASRLLGLAGAGGGAAGIAPLLARARTELSKQSGGGLDRDLLSLFAGEVAVSITPALPAPTLTLVARTKDEAATARTLKRLQGPLAALLKPTEGPAPTWKGVDGAFQLSPASGIELAYAVADGKLIVSTRLDGVRAARKLDGRLPDDPAFDRVLGDRTSGRVTSVVFLDLSQLLRLGEQTGLNDSRAYLAVKDDLQRVKSVGARSTGDGRESTAEILLSIP